MALTMQGITFEVDDVETNPSREWYFYQPDSVTAVRRRVDFSHDNSFLQTIELAFAAHFPLSLSPDHIWLVLCQGLANHIVNHVEKLREKLVIHQGRLALQVATNYEQPEDQIDWKSIFYRFAQLVKDHSNSRLPHNFTTGFSTSGRLEESVMNITLMFAAKEYFEYDIPVWICGIPRITLEGLPEDWMMIRQRVQTFREFGLDRWVNTLEPILDQFVAASQNRIDRDFWRRIFNYSYEQGCGHTRGEEQKTGWCFSLVHADELAGYVAVPVRWINRDKSVRLLELVAGFTSITQDNVTGTVRPAIGWYIRNKVSHLG